MNLYHKTLAKLCTENKNLAVLMQFLNARKIPMAERLQQLLQLEKDLPFDEATLSQMIQVSGRHLVSQLRDESTEAQTVFEFWSQNHKYRPSNAQLLPLLTLPHTKALVEDMMQQNVDHKTPKNSSEQISRDYFIYLRTGQMDTQKINEVALKARRESGATRHTGLAAMIEDIVLLPTTQKIKFFQTCGLNINDVTQYAMSMKTTGVNFGNFLKNLVVNFDLSQADEHRGRLYELIHKTIFYHPKIKTLDAQSVGTHCIKIEGLDVHNGSYKESYIPVYAYCLNHIGFSMQEVSVLMMAAKKKDLAQCLLLDNNTPETFARVASLIDKEQLEEVIHSDKKAAKFKL